MLQFDYSFWIFFENSKLTVDVKLTSNWGFGFKFNSKKGLKVIFSKIELQAKIEFKWEEDLYLWFGQGIFHHLELSSQHGDLTSSRTVRTVFTFSSNLELNLVQFSFPVWDEIIKQKSLPRHGSNVCPHMESKRSPRKPSFKVNRKCSRKYSHARPSVAYSVGDGYGP